MEWFSELIGFLIVLFVFLLPLLRKWILDRKKKKQPTEDEKEEILEEEEEFVEETHSFPPSPPPTPHRLLKPGYEFSTNLQKREFETSFKNETHQTGYDPQFRESIVSKDFLKSKKKKRNGQKENPIVLSVKRKEPLHAMVVISEIYGPPKSMQ